MKKSTMEKEIELALDEGKYLDDDNKAKLILKILMEKGMIYQEKVNIQTPIYTMIGERKYQTGIENRRIVNIGFENEND